ncbi:D-alanyl-D-alanine carboxypeptidase family protein [Cochlodiniinecator piscidefendens]|uniref:D-alanyl-D-alanine carboxypeptidase family protein n=1 Tax=Cochlodiniinecator piscidefendens TaxID=2715756 RepID=UPI00140A5F19
MRLGQGFRTWWTVALCAIAAIFVPLYSIAAPYAAMVIDARNGEVLHSRNADTRLHPASLTKMMTLYIAFEAVENGEISLDTEVRISRNAAAEPPSELGLQTGQRIALRYLIRAAAVKSANDAATAIGEAIEGSEAAFARRMNRTAQALGMSRTTFRNANGLTEEGHLSTARDMTTLGRHLFYDYPQYYNIFSRRSTDAGLRVVNNTNRRLLNAYNGADGIKTGYTRAAGFNLVASAERNGERIIATVFGGRSTATRNARVAELLDLGFSRAPRNVAINRPARPNYGTTTQSGSQVIARSLRPTPRPDRAPSQDLMLALENEIQQALEEAQEAAATESIDLSEAEEIPQEEPIVAEIIEDPIEEPEVIEVAEIPEVAEPVVEEIVVAEDIPEASESSQAEPQTDPEVILASLQSNTILIEPEPSFQPQAPIIVTRTENTGARDWGVSIGYFNSQYHAERALMRTALNEMTTLDATVRRVHRRSRGFQATFVGLTEGGAALACRRLQARGTECETVTP